MCGSGDSPADDRSTRDFLDDIGRDPWRHRFQAIAQALRALGRVGAVS
jgi:hypothetical protein